MSRDELIDRIASAIARYEGYYVTPAEARQRRIRYPTIAIRNANPGCIRRWRTSTGREYPVSSDHVDFVAWARARRPNASEEEIRQAAEREGWRVLRVLIGRYIDGKFHGGKSPTLREMMRVYAPSSDGNQPEAYAAYVARFAGIPLDVPLSDLITK